MIEVLALAGAVTKIAGGISSAVQAGIDINSLMPHFGKLAKLEDDIAIAESGKPDSFWSTSAFRAASAVPLVPLEVVISAST